MNFVCIIPSRYASTRLPGKPLCDIAGKPMVQRVYEQAAKASKLTAVVVAVDNPKVYDTVVTFGGHAVMTREDHANGTDRLAEAVGHRQRPGRRTAHRTGRHRRLVPGL